MAIHASILFHRIRLVYTSYLLCYHSIEGDILNFSSHSMVNVLICCLMNTIAILSQLQIGKVTHKSLTLSMLLCVIFFWISGTCQPSFHWRVLLSSWAFKPSTLVPSSNVSGSLHLRPWLDRCSFMWATRMKLLLMYCYMLIWHS